MQLYGKLKYFYYYYKMILTIKTPNNFVPLRNLLVW